MKKIDKIMTVSFNNTNSLMSPEESLSEESYGLCWWWVCVEGIIFILLITVGRLSLKVGSAIPEFGSWFT